MPGKPVFEGLSFEAHAGTMTAILGNNGAGKSTLLNLLASITSPSTGEVYVSGKSLRSMNKRETTQHIAYVTQQQRIPHLSVYDEVLLGRKPHVSWSVSEHDRAVVAAALKQLELEPFVDRYCDELSGGERQKVYIARAIAQQPRRCYLMSQRALLILKTRWRYCKWSVASPHRLRLQRSWSSTTLTWL